MAEEGNRVGLGVSPPLSFLHPILNYRACSQANQERLGNISFNDKFLSVLRIRNSVNLTFEYINNVQDRVLFCKLGKCNILPVSKY